MKRRAMLTKKQSELLRFIHERLQEGGVPPSFDEMKDALDLRSKSGIHRLILALEERNFIRRLPNRARRRPASGPGRAEAERAVSVPVMGRIAAGTPISAIQTRTDTITMAPEF